MKDIKLTQDKVAVVDDEDFERVNQYKWQAVKRRNNFHAVTGSHKYGNCMQMANFIMGEPPNGLVWDHEDKNGLNNTKRNIRLASHSQNAVNKKAKVNSNGFRGVRFDKRRRDEKYYFEQITCTRKLVHLGHFHTAEEAAKAYDQTAKRLFGKFAQLNFP